MSNWQNEVTTNMRKTVNGAVWKGERHLELILFWGMVSLKSLRNTNRDCGIFIWVYALGTQGWDLGCTCTLEVINVWMIFQVIILDETIKDVDLDIERRSKNQGTPPFRYWVDRSKKRLRKSGQWSRGKYRSHVKITFPEEGVEWPICQGLPRAHVSWEWRTDYRAEQHVVEISMWQWSLQILKNRCYD